MNNLPNLYIGTEESPLDNANVINVACEESNLDISFTNLNSGFPQLTVTQVGMNLYKIDGIKSRDFNETYCFIMSQGKSKGRGKGSFVDFLFFLTNNIPTTSDIPFLALEHTKNSTKESGNMSNQRSSKSIALSKIYGQSVPYIYMVESNNHKTPSLVHRLAFGRIKCLGGKVLFADEGTLGYREAPSESIFSAEDLVMLESKKRKAFYGISNQISKFGNTFVIQSNLLKSSGPHDPNEGFVSSSINVLSKFVSNPRFILESHGRDSAWFSGKDNKLMRALSGHNVYARMKDGSLLKVTASNSKRQQYWKHCNTGEKLSTFSLEVQLRLQGWKTIFTNHAGCGKSNVVSPIDGSSRTLSKSDKHGQTGIPDIVMYHPVLNKCLVIEGETSKNYQKGVVQVKDPAFKACFQEQILPLLPTGTVCESYICTYGQRVKNKHNFFSLTPTGGMSFEKNAKPIWRIVK